MTSLTVAIPAFNEEESVERVVDAVFVEIPKIVDDFEVVIVNDGSTDRTGEILDRLAAERPGLTVVHHDTNQGFPQIVFTLVEHSTKELYCGISADGEVNLDDLRRMIAEMSNGFDIIIGVRRSKANYNLTRKAISWLYNRSVQLAFGVNLRDIGATKLYRTEVLQRVQIKSRSAFANAEYLVKATRMGYRVGFVAIDQLPRLGGKAKGGNPRWVRDSTIDLLRLAWDVYSGKVPRSP